MHPTFKETETLEEKFKRLVTDRDKETQHNSIDYFQQYITDKFANMTLSELHEKLKQLEIKPKNEIL